MNFCASRRFLFLVWRQRVRNVLARVRPAADGHHDVLLAVHHIGHRGASLRRGHEHGADFLAGRFVVGAQHRAARMIRGGRYVSFACNHQRFRHQRPDVVGPLASARDVHSLQRRAIAHHVRRLPVCDLPGNLTPIEVDRGNRSIGRLHQRQAINIHGNVAGPGFLLRRLRRIRSGIFAWPFQNLHFLSGSSRDVVDVGDFLGRRNEPNRLHARVARIHVHRVRLGIVRPARPIGAARRRPECEGPLGTLTLGTASGGTNWPGGSYDPETHTVYVYACNSCMEPIGLVPAPKEISDINYIAGTAGQEVEILKGPGENAGADSPKPPKKKAGAGYVPMNIDGLPLVKPPYGTISAINLDRGEISWQIAHGETDDVVRNSPALKGMNIPRTGQETYNIGTLVTKTLVIAGEGHVTTTADHPRGAMLRAYDKATGKDVGAVFMPAPQTGSPMTYMVNGKQYIVVAVSGGPDSGEYISYTLPPNEE